MSDAWELLAQWPGGTVPALAAVGDSSVLAATSAGLHISSDGGRSWRWLGLGPTPVPEALVVSSSFERDRTVLLGTGVGLFRSRDGGTRWHPVVVGSRVQCMAATPDFTDAGIVLAGTESDGILRSENGGSEWGGASAGLLDLNVTALALSPDFAADRTALAGTASGLYRSRNGGRAWRLVELGPEAPAIQALAISPTFEDDGFALAGTEADGLFRSDDGGQTWGPVPSFPEPCVTTLAFGPTSDGSRLVVAGTAAGVALSRDGGQSWQVAGSELGAILALTLPGAPVTGGLGSTPAILVGTIDLGVMCHTPGGQPLGPAWTTANEGLAGRAAVGLSVLDRSDTAPVIAVTTLDSGVLVSSDGGASWRASHQGLADLACSSVILVAPKRGSAVAPAIYATFSDGLYLSDDLGAMWRRVELPVTSTTAPSFVSCTESSGDVPPMLVACGRGCLLLSRDGGESWQPLPLPPDRSDLAGAFASPDLARDVTIYAVARVTRANRDGTTEPAGLELWQTDNLGQRWHRWLESPTATVMSVATPVGGGLGTSLLVGHAGRVGRPQRSAQEVRQGERRPLWLEVQLGHLGSAITALAVSPRAHRDRTVLAASDASVFISRDGGETLSAWNHGLNLPLVTGLALATGEGDVLIAYALGLGGTLWRRTV